MTDDTPIHRLERDGRTITLIGTAHVSHESADLVRRTIEAEQPDTVCIELCESRLQSVRQKSRWQEMDIIKVVKEKKAFLLLSNLILASFQKRIADRMDIKPGQEMITAVEVAIFYIPFLEPVLVPLLLVLSAAKFILVVMFFMHLKFDSKLYRALFVGPLVVAVAVPVVGSGVGFANSALAFSSSLSFVCTWMSSSVFALFSSVSSWMSWSSSFSMWASAGPRTQKRSTMSSGTNSVVGPALPWSPKRCAAWPDGPSSPHRKFRP